MSSNTVANRVGAQNNQLRTRGGLGAKSVPHRLINVRGIQAAQDVAVDRTDENIVIPYDASNSTNDSVNEDDVAFYLQNIPCLLTATGAFATATFVDAALPLQTIEIDTRYVDNSTAAAAAAAAAAGVEGVSNLTHKVEVEFFGEGSNVTGMDDDLDTSGPAGANNANEFSQPTSGHISTGGAADAPLKLLGKTLGIVHGNIQTSTLGGAGLNSIMIQRAQPGGDAAGDALLTNGANTNQVSTGNASVLTSNVSMIVRLVKRVRRLDISFMGGA